jgi:hypothetical protein
MQSVYNDVLILCPEAKTGGPEALHQLGHQIALHGGSAQMVYYAPFSRIEIDTGILRCHADASPMPRHYMQYHPRVLKEARLGPDTLIVFPEPLSALAADADVPYQRALWWLSLDNALPGNPGLLDANYRRGFFADAGLMHLYQSDYAGAFLRANKAMRHYPLSDYTDQDFIHHALISSEAKPIAERTNRICFFPNKGEALAARFFHKWGASTHPVEIVPIREMTKAQVRQTLSDARIYVDFGGHPGKDRVPREAAIAGAIVLLHATGAANHYSDHPLDKEYLFTEADIESGRLQQTVATILDDPEPHLARQRLYRDAILLERERFDLEVRALFFTGAQRA